MVMDGIRANNTVITMAHLPEIGAKTGTRKTVPVSDASVMQFGTEFFRYQFPVTNRTCSTFVPVYGTSFLAYGADFSYVCHGH